MSECPYESRLSAFHDHELDGPMAEKLQSHLDACPTCNEQLQGIRAVSRLLHEAPSARMSQMGVARLHATADAAARKRDVFPMFKMLSAVAASILVIAGAWLVEMPGQTRGGSASVSPLTPTLPWERTAMGYRVEVQQGVVPETDVAYRASNWMLENLKPEKSDSGT